MAKATTRALTFGEIVERGGVLGQASRVTQDVIRRSNAGAAEHARVHLYVITCDTCTATKACCSYVTTAYLYEAIPIAARKNAGVSDNCTTCCTRTVLEVRWSNSPARLVLAERMSIASAPSRPRANAQGEREASPGASLPSRGVHCSPGIFEDSRAANVVRRRGGVRRRRVIAEPLREF